MMPVRYDTSLYEFIYNRAKKSGNVMKTSPEKMMLLPTHTHYTHWEDRTSWFYPFHDKKHSELTHSVLYVEIIIYQ